MIRKVFFVTLLALRRYVKFIQIPYYRNVRSELSPSGSQELSQQNFG